MTHFTGNDHPDQEPRRNQYTAEERRSKFTDEVAKTVMFGDTYLMRRAPGSQRYYIAPDGDTDADLICVTHIFKPRWSGSDEGSWQPYDTVGQIVLKIRADDVQDVAHEGYRAIESALYHTKLGRALGSEALRPLAQELAEKFGLKNWSDYESSTRKFTVNTDDEMRVKNALVDLLTYAPENGYAEELGPIFADADGVGYARDGVAYASLINGESDGFDGDRDGEPLPLLSEPVYYGVLGGKGEGRSFKVRLEELMVAAGVDEGDLR